jgi:hypothetical protein
MMITRILLLLIIALVALPALAEEGVADARRHMLRGIAAIEIAKSSGELSLAADEFGRATELDPKLSAAWYNLGSVQLKMGKFDAAIASYKQYLELEPKAEDAQKIQDELVKLEFRQEQVNISTKRAGTWIASDGRAYLMKVDGNLIAMETYESFSTIRSGSSTTYMGSYNFRLQASGSQLVGTWKHAAFKVEKCLIPDESGDVTGELNDAVNTLVLHYVETTFRADAASFWDDSCVGVEPVEKKEVKRTMYGPLPRGGLGVTLDATSYRYNNEGQLIFDGPVTATAVPNDSAAFASGLRQDDTVLAVNGVEVKTMTLIAFKFGVRGEPGTIVNLTVLHKGSKEPATLQLKRVKVPDYILATHTLID